MLLGHSHGSLITLRALCDGRPPGVVAAIVRVAVPRAHASPCPGYKKLLARVASRVAPRLAQPNALRVEDLTHDAAEAGRAHRRHAVLRASRRRDGSPRPWPRRTTSHEHAARIGVPTTWLVGGDDPIADPAQSRRVASAVQGADYHDLAGMRHEVFNEVERGKVLRGGHQVPRSASDQHAFPSGIGVIRPRLILYEVGGPAP